MANILELGRIIASNRSTIEVMQTNRLLKNDLNYCDNLCSKVMDISLTDRKIF